MTFFLFEYLGILVLFIVSIIVSVLIILLSFSLAPVNYSFEKSTAYECGFDAFEDARCTHDVRFFRVGILFLIFDLELCFLFPWSVVLSTLNLFGFFTMIVFLGILTIGFIYEYKKGALDW